MSYHRSGNGITAIFIQLYSLEIDLKIHGCSAMMKSVSSVCRSASEHLAADVIHVDDESISVMYN